MTESVFPYYCVDWHNPCGRQRHASTSCSTWRFWGLSLYSHILPQLRGTPEVSLTRTPDCVGTSTPTIGKVKIDCLVLSQLVALVGLQHEANFCEVLVRPPNAVPGIRQLSPFLTFPCLKRPSSRPVHVLSFSERHLFLPLLDDVAVEADTSSADHPRFTIKYLSAPAIMSRVLRTPAESVRYYAGPLLARNEKVLNTVIMY